MVSDSSDSALIPLISLSALIPLISLESEDRGNQLRIKEGPPRAEDEVN
jgi:hypothetical protein